MTGGNEGGGKPPPITGEEVQGWFERFSKPHPSADDCSELAWFITGIAWPDPNPLHDAGVATVWNFDGVPKAAKILLANLPLMLSPFAVPAIRPGDHVGRAALVELQAALERAVPYLESPYRRTDNNRHRLKSWHVPAALLKFPIFGALVRAGHRRPGITRNSIVVGVLRLALERMGHGTIEPGAIGQHLTRWLTASGMTTNDLVALCDHDGIWPHRR